MFDRLLIANRGEIAVRIARTAHRLGIGTVGVHADTDRQALHVDAVDVSVALGGSSPATSYLRMDAVVQAALDTRCDAVHPGYGFLAERAAFAAAVEDAGLVWVGPTADQIELLGDKLAAKRAAVEAGVPTTQVWQLTSGEVPDDLPLPALVKAAAGGGGRGMRVVRSADELADAIVSASREAESAFGDGTVFVEPYLERGRHIEVQILGDHHGTVVHLGERDCSIQRRNQKVVEEAPAPGLDDAIRSSLHEGAVALARHAGYRNAGTVEFLVGADGAVTFLEVNTRLQVEHPVTEAVTGLDLVELQLRIAAGEPLSFAQTDVACVGHAIEARVVAEDPGRGWLPDTGRIERFAVGEGVRVDAGVSDGSEVSAEYDSLLAKVISHGPDRGAAGRQLAHALRRSVIAGVRTDVDTLVAVLEHPAFRQAEVHTGFLDEHAAVLDADILDTGERWALLVAAVLADEDEHRRVDPHWGFAPAGWRNVRTRGQRSTWRDQRTDEAVGVEVLPGHHGNARRVLIGAWPEPDEAGALPDDDRSVLTVELVGVGPHAVVCEIEGMRRRVSIDRSGDVTHTASAAGQRSWYRVPRFSDHDEAMVGAGPVAPLPGTVLSVHVSDGDVVAEGDVLVVVEAMKMEHTITAAAAATVVEVLVAAGDRVDVGQLLVRLEDET